ncbi:hypothetical protein ACJX0J_041192, partial [Zea mays]
EISALAVILSDSFITPFSIIKYVFSTNLVLMFHLFHNKYSSIHALLRILSIIFFSSGANEKLEVPSLHYNVFFFYAQENPSESGASDFLVAVGTLPDKLALHFLLHILTCLILCLIVFMWHQRKEVHVIMED